jgi:hypothetical protein
MLWSPPCIAILNSARMASGEKGGCPQLLTSLLEVFEMIELRISNGETKFKKGMKGIGGRRM